MAGDAIPEAPPRRDRVVVIASLAAITLLAWIYLFALGQAMESMDRPSGWGAFMGLMPMGRWGVAEYALALAMWAVMMAGMMIPSAAPVILLHDLITRRQGPKNWSLASTGAFTAGYLLIWSLFGLLAALAQGILVEFTLLTESMASASEVLTGILLIAAGLYQWTPTKRACLAHCRSPILFLARRWRPGGWGALGMGLEHGAYCLGCCWALMGILFAVGIMNLVWVAAISVLVLIERVAPFGAIVRAGTGILLVVLGAASLAGFPIA